MAYRRKSYGAKKRRGPKRRRKSAARAGRTQKVVIEVRHVGGMGPGAVSPTLGKKAPEQLRPRF